MAGGVRCGGRRAARQVRRRMGRLWRGDRVRAAGPGWAGAVGSRHRASWCGLPAGDLSESFSMTPILDFCTDYQGHTRVVPSQQEFCGRFACLCTCTCMFRGEAPVKTRRTWRAMTAATLSWCGTHACTAHVLPAYQTERDGRKRGRNLPIFQRPDQRSSSASRPSRESDFGRWCVSAAP